MKQIILGLCLFSFAIFGLQKEAFASHSKSHRKHNSYKASDFQRNRNFNVIHHRNSIRHRPKKVVYRTFGPCMPTSTIRHVSYYSPVYFDFGYSNYSSGYHINIGFD